MADINNALNIDMISNAFDRASDETMVNIFICLIFIVKTIQCSKGAGKSTGIPFHSERIVME